MLKNGLIHFSYSLSNHDQKYKAKNILESLKKLRQQINKKRSGEIQYSIEVDPGIPLYFVKDKANVTKSGEYFVVTINCKTLYPKGWINGQPYFVKKITQNGNQDLKLNAATYSQNGQCNLSDLLGILVAQQLRFNTFQLAMKEDKRILNPLGTKQIFEALYEYIDIYRNWQSEQVGKVVNIQIKYLP